jgi:hypothetical protein
MWAPSCMICSQVLFGLFPRKIQWMLSVLIIFMSVIKLQSLDWGQDDTTDSTNIWTESWKSYHFRCGHVERQSKIPPIDSTNIWTESWKSYHSRCAHVERQSKIPPTFYRHAGTIRHWEKRYGHYQQHSRRSFMDPWMPYRRPPDS